MIKSRRMRWQLHVVCMGTRRGAHRVLMGVLKEIDHLEDLGLSGKRTLKWIFRTWVRETWTEKSSAE
jgi:hypothetical protein